MRAIAAGMFASLLVAVPMAQAPTPTNTVQPTQSSTIAPTALDHLAQADRLLNGVPTTAQKDAAKTWAELRSHFTEMASAYRKQGAALDAPILQRDEVSPAKEIKKGSEPQTWKDAFSRVEDDLSVLIGGGSTLGQSTVAGAGTVVGASPVGGVANAPVGNTGTLPAPSGVPTVGTAAAPTEVTGGAATGGPVVAAKVSVIGLKDLDPALREALNQFRLEVELFYASAFGTVDDEQKGVR